MQRSMNPSVELMSRNSDILFGIMPPDLVTKIPSITSRINPAAKVRAVHAAGRALAKEGGVVRLGCKRAGSDESSSVVLSFTTNRS